MAISVFWGGLWKSLFYLNTVHTEIITHQCTIDREICFSLSIHTLWDCPDIPPTEPTYTAQWLLGLKTKPCLETGQGCLFLSGWPLSLLIKCMTCLEFGYWATLLLTARLTYLCRYRSLVTISTALYGWDPWVTLWSHHLACWSQDHLLPALFFITV